ncbi:MAG TPA: L-threonylcarbamoyladenylate synthase, partial [Candidatus Thermoplasmatota archaeon]|nr:L-threonylcarbamoyladenylate synthase [Candidatus Thermoplasmatota archaeon]
AVLDAGGLCVLPTDTQYALSADALDDDAARRVFDAKRRAADQALPVCVSGLEDLRHVAYATPLARDLAARFWPGPLTLVLKARPWVPDAVTAGLGTVAVRCPRLAFSLDLARHFGPYVVTSANRSGQPAAADVESARRQLGADVRLYVDAGPLPGVPSTMVDATGDAARVLREGALAAAEVLR